MTGVEDVRVLSEIAALVSAAEAGKSRYDRLADRAAQIYAPGVHVLAETIYHWEGQSVPMPIAWIKRWGEGRVFYGGLGHELAEFDCCPAALEMNVRGLRWAAGEL